MIIQKMQPANRSNGEEVVHLDILFFARLKFFANVAKLSNDDKFRGQFFSASTY